jgi:hypothetical protein
VILLEPELRHQHVLRDQIPLRLAVGERGIEPRFLREAEHGPPGIAPLRTAGVGFQVRATLVRRRVTRFARKVLR